MPFKIKDKSARDYTTTDIAKVGIKRERNKAWEAAGYVLGPSKQKAEGPGKPGLYSIEDIYIRVLLKFLSKRGFALKEATGFIVLVSELFSEKLAQAEFDYIGFSGKLGGRGIETENLVYDDSLEGIVRKMKVQENAADLDMFLIVNFKNIRDEVNRVLIK